MNSPAFFIKPLSRRENDILTLLCQNLSDQEIAVRLVLSLNTVKWYTRQVYGKLGVTNRQEAVAVARQLGWSPAEAKAKRRAHNLPRQLSSFIGREKEIDRVSKMAQEYPLTTLTGSGGVGKTRLALQVAARALDSFRDGVWLVELASLNDPVLAPRAIVQALGLSELPGVPILDTLAGYLENRRMLLILDNCEHLLPDCAALVSELLRACPHLHILATSRAILNLPGEACFRVPSLEVADLERLSPLPELAQVEAVCLFVERAALVAPDFALSDSNAREVATICQRLDGIPLAIELAAARLRALGVAQMTERLNQIYTLLAKGAVTVQPRQQTLKATIDWSYNLLSQQERVALQRLSVFAGSWSLEGAEAVCALANTGIVEGGIRAGEVLDLLARLVDQSLVLVMGQVENRVRYRMLEMIRLYACDRLREGGGEEAARQAHLMYYLRFGREAQPHLTTRDQVVWMNRLDEELDNLRLALNWSYYGHLSEGMNLVFSLIWFLHPRHPEEAVKWTEDLIRSAAEARGSTPLQVGVQSLEDLLAWCRAVDALMLVTAMHGTTFSQEALIAMQEEAITLCRQIGNDAGREELAYLLAIKSWFMSFANPEESLLLYDEALSILRCLQHPRLPFFYGYYLGILYLRASGRGELGKAYEYLEECLAAAYGCGNLEYAAECLHTLAFQSYYRGAFSSGSDFFDRAILAYQEIGNEMMLNNVYIDKLYFETFDGEIHPETYCQAEQASVFFREARDWSSWGHAFAVFAHVAWSQGNNGQAGKFWRESASQAALHQLAGYQFDLEFTAFWLALERNDIQEAGRRIQAACPLINNRMDDGIFYGMAALDALAIYLTRAGQMALAASLFGALAAQQHSACLGVTARQRKEHEAALAALRRSLPEEAFQKAWQAGQAWTVEQALQNGLKCRAF